MQTYTVHEPPNPPESRLKRSDRLVFVREGFSWWAALLAPIWMLTHRMWLALLLYLIGVTALDVALLRAEVSPQWVSLATIAVHLVIGFEAGSLRRWSLGRRRWQMLGVVTGQSRADCERRFFQLWLGEKGGQDDGSVRLSEAAGAVSAAAGDKAADAGARPVGSEA